MKRDEFWKVVGLAAIAAVALGALLAVGISVFAEVADWLVQRMSDGER
ncbi:hypothetical protein [Allokutzneria sp. NRRL B-24872]|nr:hypothetical protein [Allokutzneria sp. NRRL B-24872]